MINRPPTLLAPFVLLPSMLCFTTALAQQPPAIAPPPAAATEAPAGPILETNPAVLAAQEWPRTRPADALRAVLALTDLGRPELAKPILEELVGRGLPPLELAALVEQFGSHRMLQMSLNADLAPAGSVFAEACMAAAGAAATDPQRLALLVAQLSDPAAEVRLAARVDLMAAGRAGVKAVLESLAREADSQRRAALANAAVQMHPLAVGPLVAMLETSDASLRADVARMLVAINVPQTAPLLVSASSTEAEPYLLRALDEYQRGSHAFAPDSQNQVELWQWDDATKSLAAALYPADAARTIWMARLARRLSQLRPENRAYQRRALVLGLESLGLATPVGTIPPAYERLQNVEVALLNEILADALAGKYPHAAAAVSDALGRRGDIRVLFTSDGQPSPLATALKHADRRVRFAALRAIMTLDPASPFPGSSGVPEVLAYFVRSAGQRTALVAMPTAAAATDVAGKLAVAGLDGEATNLGADVARLAAHMSDLELVLVDMDIQAPDVRQVLYELRITPPAGQAPVALLAADGRLEAAHRLADEHERMIAVPRPHTADAVAKIASRLLQISERDAVPANGRALQAVEAVAWTAGLVERGRTFYALRRESPAIEAALLQPATAAGAIAALARFGTPESQRALVKFASHRTLPIEARRQAASAFDHSVKSRGLLLTSDEIVSQYTLYNASAAADADTQQVLASLLDTIESRRAMPANAASTP